VCDQVVVGAPAAQPGEQPRRRTPIQLVERTPVAGGGAAHELVLVGRVQAPFHNQLDESLIARGAPVAVT
jgi:hypothetical protein